MKNSSQNQRFFLPDRGYFGEPLKAAFSNEPSLRIVVTHSFGLFLVPNHILEKADLLVSISGFRQFHTSGREGKFSRRLINLMLKKFINGSFDVTHEFRAMCGTDDKNGIVATDEGIKRLADDLEILSNASLDLEYINKIPSVLIIQGAEDRIVWPERAEDLNASIPESSLVMVDGADHGLPFTHYDRCIDLIFDYIKEK